MMSPKQDDSIARKREELQRFIDARGLKVRPWAERAGLSHGTVRNFLTGRSQTMTQATIEALAVAADATPADMFPSLYQNQGRKGRDSLHSQELVEAETIPGRVTVIPGGEALFHGPRDLPILGHVKGGDGAWFIDQGVRLGVTMRPPMLANNREAYATRVHDVSMSPALEPGWVLFVDPHRPAKPGDNVIIQMTDGQALVKRLVRRTERAIICEQFNPKQPVEFKPSKVKAIHLVVLISPFEP